MLEKFKPSVPRNWLLLLAGLMWGVAGIILLRMAYAWLAAIHWHGAASLGLIGAGTAFGVYRFGFSKIAHKNIQRICCIAQDACVFAFQAWRGYLILVLMVAGGILLRNSPVPKHYLAAVYTAIGGGLLLASRDYFAQFLHLRRAGE